MADDSERPIEQVGVGDRVATSEGNCEVGEVFERHTAELVYHLFAGNQAVRLTGDHPVKTKAGWISARDLKVGDEILTVAGHEYQTDDKCNTE